jgi:hypothetical protein
MIRNCDFCGEPYEYQLNTSRFCCDSHRALNNGKPKPEDGWPRRKLFASDDPENDPVHILQMRRKARRDGDDEALVFWMARWRDLPPSVTDPKGTRW